MDWDTVLFNVAAFISALFVLEFGADKFVDHTAVVARRLGVSEVLVALLTAGAEWEELVVVVSSLYQNRSSLAIGNVFGSNISNILGAFSLGLLFHTGRVKFDASSKIYSTILLLLTTSITSVALWGRLGRLAGVLMVTAFIVYVGSIAWGIYRGTLVAPEASDSESDDDSSDEDGSDSDVDAHRQTIPKVVDVERPHPSHTTGSENSPLLSNVHGSPAPKPKARKPRSLSFHVLQLFIGFLCLCISGYVLSHTAATLSDALNLSGTVLGMTILSFATTLPEKFVAVLSGTRGHPGILIANTVGSNVFLLTLCLGVVLLSTDGKFDTGSVSTFELVTMWSSSAFLCLVVFVGAGRWVGVFMVLLYVGFLVCEFTFFRR